MRVLELLEAPTTLYRFYSTADELLYIGISVNFDKRRQQHSKDKQWWEEVHRWTLTEYPCRMDAAVAERDAIIAELPKYNYVHHPARHPFSGARSHKLGLPKPLPPTEMQVLERVIQESNFPADHAEILRRELLADLETVGTNTLRPTPRTEPRSEIEHARAMQAKRRARGVS